MQCSVASLRLRPDRRNHELAQRQGRHRHGSGLGAPAGAGVGVMAADRSRALPTVRTADHIGLTVPDLDAAAAFFVEVLGFDLVYSHAPSHPSGDVQERQFDSHPDTRIVGIAMLTLGTLNLELFECDAPDQRQEMPRISDWGGTHIALYVDDMDAALDHLRAHGIRVLGEPMALPGPERGSGNRFVFVQGPGGLPIELITYPGGKAYESATDRRLFDPRASALWRAAARPSGSEGGEKQ